MGLKNVGVVGEKFRVKSVRTTASDARRTVVQDQRNSSKERSLHNLQPQKLLCRHSKSKRERMLLPSLTRMETSRLNDMFDGRIPANKRNTKVFILKMNLSFPGNQCSFLMSSLTC